MGDNSDKKKKTTKNKNKKKKKKKQQKKNNKNGSPIFFMRNPYMKFQNISIDGSKVKLYKLQSTRYLELQGTL